MREKFFEPTGGLGRQALEHVLEVTVRIVSVELRGLDSAHDVGGALSRTLGSDEEPARPAMHGHA